MNYWYNSSNYDHISHYTQGVGIAFRKEFNKALEGKTVYGETAIVINNGEKLSFRYNFTPLVNGIPLPILVEFWIQPNWLNFSFLHICSLSIIMINSIQLGKQGNHATQWSYVIVNFIQLEKIELLIFNEAFIYDGYALFIWETKNHWYSTNRNPYSLCMQVTNT